MKTARILSINFGSLSLTAFGRKAGAIVEAITEADFVNYFPVIKPTQEVVVASYGKFKSALDTETSTSVKFLRLATRADLTEQLVLLALNLEQTADGDMVKLSRTGYDINKPTGGRSTGTTPIPENVRVSNGLSGQVIAKCKAVGRNIFYLGEYSLDPINGPWIPISGVTNSQMILFKGLERGRDYYFRIKATGPHGPSDWSDIATIMVH